MVDLGVYFHDGSTYTVNRFAVLVLASDLALSGSSFTVAFVVAFVMFPGQFISELF